jgi:hypothetical protein
VEGSYGQGPDKSVARSCSNHPEPCRSEVAQGNGGWQVRNHAGHTDWALQATTCSAQACSGTFPHMSRLPEGEPQAFDPGEAYQRCMRELGRPYPDHEAAQLYATLSLEETLRDVAAQLAQLTKEVVLASRRR